MTTQIEEFQDLKQEYQEYIESLKEQLDELENAKSSVELQKKKFNYLDATWEFPAHATVFSTHGTYQYNEPVFKLVNRDQQYLVNGAIKHGRKHNIEDAVTSLYQMGKKKIVDAVRTWHTRKPRVVIKRQKLQPHLYHTYRPDFPVQWPLDSSKFWISSHFGPRRKKDRTWGFHYGVDMAAIKGTPVYAIADGMVIEASYSPKGYGKAVVIAHDTKYRSRYAHLDSIYVRQGQQVQRGKLIGRVGDTGAVRGRNASHLHLEVMILAIR